MKSLFALFLAVFTLSCYINAQDFEYDSDFYEVFLIDSYVTPEIPHTFVLTFFTPDEVTSKISIDDNYEFIISEVATEDHNTKIDISQIHFDSLYVTCKIMMKDADGNDLFSEPFELALPNSYEIAMDDAPGLLTTCCFGGVVFGLPSPNVILTEEGSFFSLTKEIPVLTYYSRGYNYPDYYMSLEYTYVFESHNQHIGRLGLKKIFLFDPLEYVAPGITFFSDFKGTNGIGPELTIGLFKISTVFTFYSKYRYNLTFNDSKNSFHEISLGLYSSFFSINL